MRIRHVGVKTKRPTLSLPKKKPKTHEERAIDDIFAEREDVIDTELHLDPPPDREDETFDAIEYDIDHESMVGKWEEVARSKAQSFTEILVHFYATLDGLMAAEDFMNKKFIIQHKFSDQNFLNDLVSALIVKLKTSVLTDFDLQDEQEMAVFLQTFIGNNAGKDAAKSLKDWIKSKTRGEDDGSDGNPYGNIGAIVKSLGEK